MADFSNIKEAGQKEELIVHRGLVVFASMLAGISVVFAILRQLNLIGSDVNEVVGLLAMGLISPYEQLSAVLMLVGGIIGAILGQWLWLAIAQVQRLLGHLPVITAMKRAAVPFAVFLPQLTYLYQGCSLIIFPVVAFLGLAIGFILLAFLEQRDKRKIFFANPTENDYHPIGVFTHGGIIALGSGVGWFIQSLPAVQTSASAAGGGLWFALGIGIIVWILSLLVAALIGLFYSKQTFDQVYLGVALALLPMAFLPLQTTGLLYYLEQGKTIIERQVSWLPMLLGGVAVIASLAFLVINLIQLRRQPAEVNPAWEELFRALMLIVAIPFLIYAVAYWPAGPAYSRNILVGPLDLFREGESLSAAQAMLMGRLPFKEILLRHGFLADVVSGLTAIQWFGSTVESYRLLLALLAPLGLVAIYLLAIFCLPWLWALLLTLTILTGHLGTVPMTRFFFPLVGFIFTLYFIQRHRWPVLIFSGLFTAFSLIASFTAGIMALSGHIVLLAGYMLFGPNKWKIRLAQFSIYLGATFLALLPWWFYLAMSGSLAAYFENFSWILSYYTSVFGLPLPGLGDHPTITQILLFALPPVAILSGVLAIISALKTIRETGFLPWNILLLLTLTGLFWMRFVSRSEFSFLQDALPIAGMLIAFFLYRLTAHQRLVRGLILAAFLPALFIPQPGKLVLPELAGSFGNKHKIQIKGMCQSKAERLNQVYLPTEQAKHLDQLVEYLEGQVGTSETFYDFSNQPLLYFLVPRRPVIRSLSTAGLATFSQQLQAIHNLANADIKAVVFQGKPFADVALDGIPSVVRQYAVSEYLLQNFVPVRQIGNWVIFVPNQKDLVPTPRAVAGLDIPLDLYQLPLRWGDLGKYDPGQGGTVARFVLPAAEKAVAPAGVTATAQGGVLQISDYAGSVQIHLTCQANEGKLGNVLVVQLKASAGLDGKTAILSWSKANRNHRVMFTVKGDNQTHRYAFRVGAFPTWIHQKAIRDIYLELPQGGWTWESTTLLRVQDIPELAQVKPLDLKSKK